MKFTLILLPLFALYVNIVAVDVDWTKANVSPARMDMGPCNGNPIMTAIDAIQSKVSIMNPAIGRIILSEQQILDCMLALAIDCSKVKVDEIYTYLQNSAKPIATGASYPLTGSPGPCRYANATPSKAKLIKFVKVLPADESGLEAALAFGPVVVNMDADNPEFQAVKADGIYTPPTTCGKAIDILNHWVLLVATRTDPILGKIFVFKNTFGDKWGRYGFFIMKRDGLNKCGIATNAMYPILDPTLLV